MLNLRVDKYLFGRLFLNFIEFLQFKSQKHDISTKGKSQQKSPEELGWPPGFFEQTYGSCQDDPIVIDDEDNFAQREEAAWFIC